VATVTTMLSSLLPIGIFLSNGVLVWAIWLTDKEENPSALSLLLLITFVVVPPLVAIKSADYEFDHPDPNHFGLRVDFSEIPGLRAGGYYQFELPVGGRFVRQLESTFANNIYLKGFANLRVICGRTIRNNSLAQVARIRKDDSLLLEDWRGAEKKDKRPLVKALVVQVHNPPTTGQLYLVVSFANPVAEKA
jgi:hypothetical protein